MENPSLQYIMSGLVIIITALTGAFSLWVKANMRSLAKQVQTLEESNGRCLKAHAECLEAHKNCEEVMATEWPSDIDGLTDLLQSVRAAGIPVTMREVVKVLQKRKSDG